MNLIRLFLKNNIKEKDCISVLLIGAITVAIFNILPIVLQAIFYSFNKYGAFLMEYYTYKTIIKFVNIIFIGYFLYTYFNFIKYRSDLFYLYKLFGADKLEILGLNLLFGFIIYISSIFLGSLLFYCCNKLFYIAISRLFNLNSLTMNLDFSGYINSVIIWGGIILLSSLYNSLYILFNDSDKLYVKSVVDKKDYNKNYRKDNILSILLIALSIIFTILYSLRIVSFYLGIMISLFSFVLGYTILMSNTIFSCPFNLRIKNKVLESITLDSSLNRFRKLNRIVVNSNIISAFILMYVFSIFLLSYWGSVSDNDIEKPYIYDVLIIGNSLEDITALSINSQEVGKSIIFPSYILQLGADDYNVTSQTFYNKIVDENLHLENGCGKLIETTSNDDNWIVYEGEQKKFYLKSGEKSKNILINSLDGRYVFKGLVEWDNWLILSDKDFEELMPESKDKIHYSELIRYNADNRSALNKKINELVDKNGKLSVYYKDIIVNLLRSSQKLMVFVVALIVLAIKIFILYLYKIKIKNEYNFILEKYKLLNLLGMGKEIYSLLRKEVFLIYFKPAIITYFIVPLVAMFPYFIDIETEKSMSSFFELIKFGFYGFGGILILFIVFDIAVYFKISKDIIRNFKVDFIKVCD